MSIDLNSFLFLLLMVQGCPHCYFLFPLLLLVSSCLLTCACLLMLSPLTDIFLSRSIQCPPRMEIFPRVRSTTWPSGTTTPPFTTRGGSQPNPVQAVEADHYQDDHCDTFGWSSTAKRGCERMLHVGHHFRLWPHPPTPPRGRQPRSAGHCCVDMNCVQCNCGQPAVIWRARLRILCRPMRARAVAPYNETKAGQPTNITYTWIG